MRYLIAMFLILFTGITASADVEKDQGLAEPYFKAELIFEPGSAGFESCHGSTIEELPGGDVIAAWYGGTAEKAKDVAIYASIMDVDNGNWSKPWIIHDVPEKSEGNPVLWTGPEGKLWLFYVTIMKDNWDEAQMFYKTSNDRGKTWTEPVALYEELGWMTRNKPLELRDGGVLLPVYNEILFDSAFLFSPDGGKNWKQSKRIRTPGGCIQPSAVELPDGKLITGMRTGSDNGLLWWSTSENRGRSWTKPYTTDVRNPGSGADMVMLQSGNIALAFNDSSVSRNPINVAVSTDGGKTWPFNRDLEPGQDGSFSYPAIIQSSNGLIHITYTYRRESIKHVAVSEEWVKQDSEQ